MSESRALLSLSTLLASALLMSGTLLLLQATVKWGAPNIEVEDPVALRAGSGSLSTRVASGASSRQEQEKPSLHSIASPPAMAAEPDYAGSAPDEPEAVADPSVGNAIAMPPSEDGTAPAPSDTGPSAKTAEPEGGPAFANASPDLTPDGTLVSASRPGKSAPDQLVDAAASPHIPEDSASDQAEEEIASREEAPVEPVSESVSHHLATEEEAQKAAPPLPRRRPVQSAALTSEPVARSGQREHASRPSKPRWKAMTLAPNELATKPPQQAKRPNTASYNATVWSALARHKPRAGRRGSASVTFGIGAKGQLRFVRVSGSSGNPKLDRLALATVRNAAPFPSPPKGAQSFTIRIHFR